MILHEFYWIFRPILCSGFFKDFEIMQDEKKIIFIIEEILPLRFF